MKKYIIPFLSSLLITPIVAAELLDTRELNRIRAKVQADFELKVKELSLREGKLTEKPVKTTERRAAKARFKKDFALLVEKGRGHRGSSSHPTIVIEPLDILEMAREKFRKDFELKCAEIRAQDGKLFVKTPDSPELRAARARFHEDFERAKERLLLQEGKLSPEAVVVRAILREQVIVETVVEEPQESLVSTVLPLKKPSSPVLVVQEVIKEKVVVESAVPTLSPGGASSPKRQKQHSAEPSAPQLSAGASSPQLSAGASSPKLSAEASSPKHQKPPSGLSGPLAALSHVRLSMPSLGIGASVVTLSPKQKKRSPSVGGSSDNGTRSSEGTPSRSRKSGARIAPPHVRDFTTDIPLATILKGDNLYRFHELVEERLKFIDEFVMDVKKVPVLVVNDTMVGELRHQLKLSLKAKGVLYLHQAEEILTADIETKSVYVSDKSKVLLQDRVRETLKEAAYEEQPLREFLSKVFITKFTLLPGETSIFEQLVQARLQKINRFLKDARGPRNPVPQYQVTELQTFLITQLHQAESFEMITQILEAEIQMKDVHISDKSDVQKHEEKIAKYKAVRDEHMLQALIVEETKGVMEQSGLMFVIPEDDREAVRLGIQKIVDGYFSKEIPNLTMGDPLRSLIELLRTAKTKEEVELRLNSVVACKGMLLFKNMEERFKRFDKEEELRRGPARSILTRHCPWIGLNSRPIDMTIQSDVALLKFDKNPSEKAAFDSLVSSKKTGVVIVPVGSETDQKQANMKFFFLNGQSKGVGYATVRLEEHKANFLKSLEEEGYEFWVLPGEFFFAIHADIDKPIVSLTLDQGSPNMRGQVISDALTAQALVAQKSMIPQKDTF